MLLKQTSSSKKNQRITQQTDNPIEILKDFGVGIVKSVSNDVLGGVASTATEQLGLTPQNNAKIEGTLNPNEDLDLAKFAKKEDNSFQEWIGAGKSFRKVECPVYSSQEMEVQRKIEEILKELKILAKTVDKVSSEAAKVGLEQVPTNAGVYHLNFFEWLYKLIKSARVKVQESQAWLNLFKSRKVDKQYWAMFKKHGTTFGLSQERTVATQTG